MTPVPLWWLLVDEYGALLDAGEYQTAYQDMDAYLEIGRIFTAHSF